MKVKFLFALILAFVFVGCDAPGIRQVPAAVAPASGVQVHVMAEFDGIRLYRVTGVGQTVFIAVQSNGNIVTKREECDDDGCTTFSAQTLPLMYTVMR